MKHLLLLIVLFTVLVSCKEEAKEIVKPKVEKPVAKPANIKYGFDLDKYDVYYDTVQNGWTMSHMLIPYGVNQADINLIADKAKDSLVGLNYVKSGKPFMVLTTPGDTSKTAKSLIYFANIETYFVFDFEELNVEKKSKEILIKEETLTGEIVKNSNLTLAINQQTKNFKTTAELAEGFEGIFAWSIDFFKLQAGDQFKVIYDQKSIDGEPYGIGDIKGIWFNHNNEASYAFLYETDTIKGKKGYYDEEGKEKKRPFLMSPVKFAKLTSAYNLNRFHPIYKRRKAHKGTDYAAPTGTPILATADGTVSKASRSGGNGIYVKLHHNKTYDTQYLHMSKIAKGIRPGVHVNQGDVIGYVGSTGAATGPHVCYRFWKNGKQVDHRAEKFPASEPMAKELIPDYLKHISPLKEKLEALTIVPYVEEVSADI